MKPFLLLFLALLLGGSAFAQIASDDIDPKKLQKFLQDKAMEAQAGGEAFEMEPDNVREYLQEFGVDKEELKELDDEGIMNLLMTGLGMRRAAPFSDKALKGLEIPEGLRVEAFGEDLMERIEADEPGLTMDRIRELMVEYGADKEKVDAIPIEEFNDLVGQMMGQPPTPQDEKDTYRALRVQFEELLEGHRPAVTKAYESTVGMFDGEDLLAHGIVVDARGFILSKASELKDAEKLVCYIQGKEVPANVIKTWEPHDLALVFVEAENLVPIQWTQNALPPVGSFIASPNYNDDEPIGIGLVAVAPRSLRSNDLPFLGVGLEVDGDTVFFPVIAPDQAAEQAGLKAGDRVLLLNGKKPTSTAAFIAEIERQEPGDEITLKIQRDDEVLEKNVVLGSRTREISPMAQDLERMNKMSGEVSKVRAGFPKILQTDLPIEPNQIGGPLADLRGDVIGMNIARAGRIETYAIPASVILELLAPISFSQLAKEQTKPDAALAGKPKPAEASGPDRDELLDAMKAVKEAQRALEQAQEALQGALDAVK